MPNRFTVRGSAACCLTGIILTLLALVTVPAAATPDSASHEVLLAVANLDGRCPADSLYGRSHDSHHYLPSRIVWGVNDSLHPSPFCPYPPFHVPAYAETVFEYPVWDDLRGTVSVQRLNAGDSTDELIFALYGRTTGIEPKDTIRRICLFGSSNLSSVPFINLAALPVAQVLPFAALDLAVGAHLVEPEMRGMSGRESYILLPIVPPGGPPPRTELASVGYNVRISPNPTSGPAQIQGHPVPAGEYRVEVIAVDGSVAARREVSVGADEGFFDVLDLGELATGFYLIRVYGSEGGAERLIGDYPIIKQK